nr:MAG TPA: hypothetical protein [Caudoviricetes sp.]
MKQLKNLNSVFITKCLKNRSCIFIVCHHL